MAAWKPERLGGEAILLQLAATPLAAAAEWWLHGSQYDLAEIQKWCRWDAKVIGTEPDQFLCIYLAQKSNLEPTVPAHVTFGMVVVRPRRAALHNLAPARCGATRPFLGRIGPDCPDYVSELGAGARNPSRLAVNPYCTDLLRNVYFAVRFHDLHKFMYVPACRRPYRRHLRSEPSRNLSQAVREHSKMDQKTSFRGRSDEIKDYSYCTTLCEENNPPADNLCKLSLKRSKC